MGHMSRPPASEEPLLRIALRRLRRRARSEATTIEFRRLLVFHASAAAGDSLVALALAGSLFFSVPEATARGRVALYLVLTMAPFAVVAPVLARFLDRHRASLRAVLVGAAMSRALLAWMLATRLDSPLIFPLAFGILIASRAALVVRGALLPTLLPPGWSLVGANSSLSKVAALGGIGAVLPGFLLLRFVSVRAELLLASAVYIAGAAPALRFPSARGRRRLHERLGAQARARSLPVRQATMAVAGTRFLVGFLVFHLAFAMRREDIGTLGLGLLIGAAAIGSLLGSLAAPRLRSRLREEGILVLTLAVGGAAGLLAGRWFSIASAFAFVLMFGITSGAAKVSFDSIVQRDIEDGARGWAFARFESLQQLAWVAGGAIPLAVPVPSGPGVVAVGIVASGIALLLVIGRRRAASSTLP